ncbi:hypothetical protein [Nonomuraea sp. NPDC050202]|jgi:hypothetical protein|uniref:hypothetical protein n=1 Tax=Nonomuraea sp. NPDC050202 TaxID=3155035 RepID=UPI00340E9BB6
MTTPIPATALRSPKNLLAAVVARIEHDGTLWDIEDTEEPAPNTFTCWGQRSWQQLIRLADRCGTTLCAAGYTADLAGRKWLVTVGDDGGALLAGEPTTWDTASYNTGYVLAEESDPEHEVITVSGHRVVRVQDVAVRLLGLERQTVYGKFGNPLDVPHPLFAPDNTLDDLKAWLDRLPD